jgi:hypothetical protein
MLGQLLHALLGHILCIGLVEIPGPRIPKKQWVIELKELIPTTAILRVLNPQKQTDPRGVQDPVSEDEATLGADTAPSSQKSKKKSHGKFSAATWTTLDSDRQWMQLTKPAVLRQQSDRARRTILFGFCDSLLNSARAVSPVFTFFS